MTIFSDLKSQSNVESMGSDLKKRNVLALSGRSDSKKTNVLALSWGRIRRKQMFWRCPGYKKSFYEKIRQEMALVRSIPVGFHIKRAEFCFLLSSVDLFGGRNENNIQFRVRHIRQAYTLCSEGAFC